MKTISVYTQTFGNVSVNLGDPAYNGLTIEQIQSRMQGWHEVDKKQYIANCKEIINCQMSGYNLGTIESLKNSNFFIAQRYI